MNTTIIYYTSNREDPAFEARVQENLLKVCGGLPIISVSQKPINLGKNICVGDVGTSGFNVFRQIEIACQAATTPFVTTAEADCLYPPDYFQFIPPKLDLCYRNANTYLVGMRRDYFYKKNEGGVWSQVVGRDFFTKRLAELFAGAPPWNTEEKNFPKERGKGEDVFKPTEMARFQTANPCISIKTGRGMRHYSHSDRTPIYELPYWGTGKKFTAYYLHGKIIEDKEVTG